MPDNNEQLNEAQRQQAEAAKKTTGVFSDLSKVLQDVLDDYEDHETLTKKASKGFMELDRSIRSGRKVWSEAVGDIENLRETIAKMDDGAEKTEKKRQLREVTSQSRDAVVAKMRNDMMGELVKGVFMTGASVTKSVISSYQSGASAFQTFGDVQTQVLDGTNKTVQGVASAGAAGVVALGALGVMSGGASVALSALIGVSAAVFDSFTQLAKYGVQVAIKELDTTSKAFNDASKAGATFTGGIMEFRNAGPEAGLTMVQFSRVLAENSQGLAHFGGTVSQGIKAFANVGREMLPAREGLIKLGYSIEEISSGTLKYMAMVGSVSNKQRTDYANLAKESAAYLENLRLITAFTGEDAKKAQAAADEAARDAAVDARLRKEEAEGNKDVAIKFRAMIQSLPTQELRNAYKQAYGTYGALTDENGLLMSQSGTAYRTMIDTIGVVSDKNKNASEVTAESLRLQKERAGQIQREIQTGQSAIGIAASATGEYRNLGVAMQSMNQAYSDIAKGKDPAEIQKNLSTIKDLGGTTADYAKMVVASQDLHLRMQKELDVVVTQFQKFGVITNKVIEGIQDALRKAGYDVGSNIVTSTVTSTGGGAAIVAPNMGKRRTTAEPGKAPGEGPATVTPLSKGTTGTGDYSSVLAKNLKIKSEESQAGGGISRQLAEAANRINDQIDYRYISSLNDESHLGSNSKHVEGKALDLVLNDPTAYAKTADMIRGWKDIGIKSVIDESQKPANPELAKKWAPHLHVETLANGGITKGVSIAGEAGPEAVIPLPDGRNIPVKMDVGELIEKLNEMIDVLREGNGNTEKILYASV